MIIKNLRIGSSQIYSYLFILNIIVLSEMDIKKTCRFCSAGFLVFYYMLFFLFKNFIAPCWQRKLACSINVRAGTCKNIGI